MSNELIHLTTRARTRPIQEFDMSKLLERAKERAPDPTIFDEIEPFFWRAQLSNSNLDSYFTRMSERTLRNFAADAEAGISYQNSHKRGELGFGQSLNGVFTQAGDDDVDDEGVALHRMHADFFTIPGINLNGVNTTDFIQALRAGVAKDVSVGFHATDFRCGICSGQMFDGWFGYFGDCNHIPGFSYELEEDGKKSKGGKIKRTAYVSIEDGHLSEGSSVYDGATPDAAVLKGQLMARANKLSDMDRMRFRSMFGVRLPDGDLARSIHPIAGTALDARDTKGNKMSGSKKRDAAVAEEEETQVAVLDDETTFESLDLADVVTDDESEDDETSFEAIGPDENDNENDNDGENDDDKPVVTELDTLRAKFAEQGIRIGKDPVKVIRSLAERVVELTPLAKDGVAYRKDLIDDAIKQGIRAKGDAFRTDYYTEMFKRLTLDDIKVMRDDWQADGDLRLTGGTGKGGRKTILDEETADNDVKEPAVFLFPPKAYKVGS